MTESKFQSLIRGKNVVYITVKNKDYIRSTQIKRILEKECKTYEMYSSEKGSPLTRALDLRRRMKQIDFPRFEVVILGFLPQLIWDRLPDWSAAKRPIVISDFFLSVYDTVVLDRRLVEDGHFVSRLTRKLDRRVIVGSDLVLVDTKANASFFSGLYAVTRRKFEIMYLEADPVLYPFVSTDTRTVIDEIEHADIPVEVKTINDEKESVIKTVLYFGTGLSLQGTDIVMEAFNRASSESEGSIRCVFIGSTRGIPKTELIKARNNPEIEIIHWLSQRGLSDRVRAADLCIAGHFNLYIDKASRTIPGKAFIYEAMKKPMILGDTEANHELFLEDSRHMFVPRGNAEALAECIKRFL